MIGIDHIRAPLQGDMALLADHLKARLFEQLVMPHLDSAYNLARWLTRNEDDAQDVVQEASIRAYKYFDSFEGQNSRAWLLKIVRNTYYTWTHANKSGKSVSLDDDADLVDTDASVITANAEGIGRSPEAILVEARDKQHLRRLVARTPCAYREILVLRLIEEMTYRDIAEAVGIPIGTVMSRLARARQHLLKAHGTEAAAVKG